MSDAPNPNSPWRVAVVGGGISGLAAAHRLLRAGDAVGRPLQLELFEASPRLGGSIGTRRLGEFLVETGPDMFVTDKPAALELVHELGLDDELVGTDPTHRRSLVLRNGRPEPVPPGFTLMAAAKVWPVLKSPVLSPLGKLRLGWERFVPRRRNASDTDDESLASFARRRLGSEVFDRLVQPLVGGIYTADPEQLSLRATLPRFLDMEYDHGSLIAGMTAKSRTSTNEGTAESGARYGLFVTLRSGLARLVEELEATIGARGTIHTGTRVESIGSSPVTPRSPASSEKPGFYPQWTLTLDKGESRTFDAVILATPSHVAADLLATTDPDLATRLRSIEHASSAVVCSGFRLDQFEHSLEAFGLVVPAIEQRNVLAVSFASRKFPGRAPAGLVLVRTFVGGALQPELLDRDDDDLAATVHAELAAIFGLRGKPVVERVVRYNLAMPQYHVGHLDRVTEIESRVATHPSLAIAGNAYHGVGLPDCIASGRTAAEGLLARIPILSGSR